MSIRLAQTALHIAALAEATRLTIGAVDDLKLQINTMIIARKPPYWVKDWRNKRNR